MRVQGRWLLGTNSLVNISQVKSAVQMQSLLGAEKKLHKSFCQYRPWMSAVDSLHELQELDECPSSGLLNKDHKRIDLMRGLFSDAYGMSEVSSYQTGFQMMLSNDAGFKQNVETHEASLNLILKSSMGSRFSQVVQEVNLVTSDSGSIEDLRLHGSGFSTHKYRGGIFISAPRYHMGVFENTLNLTHELGHQVLMLLQCCDDLIKNFERKTVYSVVRREDRPAIMSFHAMVAVAYMIEWLLIAPDELNQYVSKERRGKRLLGLVNDLEVALLTIKTFALTQLGHEICREFTGLLALAKENLPMESMEQAVG